MSERPIDDAPLMLTDGDEGALADEAFYRSRLKVMLQLMVRTRRDEASRCFCIGMDSKASRDDRRQLDFTLGTKGENTGRSPGSQSKLL